MNKKIIFVSLVLILVCLVILISIFRIDKIINSNLDVKEEENATAKTMAIFKQKLQQEGFVITNEATRVADFIGAKEAYCLYINGKNIEIFNFDLNSSEKLTMENIKSAKEEGIIYSPTYNSYISDVKINKNLLITLYEDHPDKDKILKIFEAL